MTTQPSSLPEEHHSHEHEHDSEDRHGTLSSYIAGFILSIILTVLAFGAVAEHWFSFPITIAFITLLAIVQLLVQLLLFLHLSSESRPYWKLNAFLFAAMIVFVIVAASIWIMYHLNANMQM